MHYFKPSEFACKCGCGSNEIAEELGVVLDGVRGHFGRPTTVTSAVRCKEHNERVGGARRSKHLLGIAADIQVKGIDSIDVFVYLSGKYPTTYGIGKYSNFTHIDVREKKARW